MKLLAEFSHPAQVHKFKHALRSLIGKGHSVLVLSRDKDVMLPLLEAEGIPHKCLSKARSSLFGLGIELLVRELRALIECLRFKPDIVLSAHSVAVTHSGWLLRIPRIVHDDTEHAKLQQLLYLPFATKIITSTAYLEDLGRKQIRINSLEPLAYLHPDHFCLDRSVLEKYELNDLARYAVVRFVSWGAAHDTGLRKASALEQKTIIEAIFSCGYSKVVLTSETPTSFNDERLVFVKPADFHHVLAGASLCLTEGGSVAYESGVLGVPTVYANPLQTGIADELVRYGLIKKVNRLQDAFVEIEALAYDTDAVKRSASARQELLRAKTNMAKSFEAILTNIARNGH
jgi:predicted glycosyltransferase